MTRREMLAALIPWATLATSPGLLRALTIWREGRQMLVRKNPGCMCCNRWADHLKEHGIQVTVEEDPNMASIKDELGVPQNLRSCHTGVIDGYVVEGHVPAEDVLRLLEERPAVVGIATPGMPIGSPGMEMEGADPEPFEVIAWSVDGTRVIFAEH